MSSAMPRYMEYVPRVTISGGSFSREINPALSAPPAQPTASAASTPAPAGRCQSLTATPKTTAASPIMEPTERSMPPVTMTGVIAIESSPSSTLKRMTSKKLSRVKKFCPIAEKIAVSATSAASRIHSPRLFNCRPCERQALFGAVAQYLDDHCGQNDCALQRAFPVRAHAEECQRWADGAEQNDAEHGACDTAGAAGHRGATNHARREDLLFHAEAGGGGNLVVSFRIQNSRDGGQGACHREFGKGHAIR